MDYKIIDGIKCYNPELIESYDNFPDFGFSDDINNILVNFWDRSRYRLFRKLILQETINLDIVNYLEVGCNNGMFIKNIVDIKKLHITGSEIYLRGLLIAKKYIHNVDFIQLDITTQSLADDKFDLITAFDVLEHIEEDELALENIYRLLKLNGKCIISVPQHRFMWSKFDEYLNHRRRYTKRELVSKLRKVGFKVSYSTSFVFLLFPLMIASRIIDAIFLKIKKGGTNQEFKQKLSFSRSINYIFDIFMRIEEFFIYHRIPLPFGGTLIAISIKN